MVCVYCESETRVVNSRHQKRANNVWRRRQCMSCQAVFTTLEGPDTGQVFRVSRHTTLEPFSRDKLLLSIHDSLKHRKTAVSDASALTNTILSRLHAQLVDAVIAPEQIAQTSLDVLNNFDSVAATHYQAFHTN